MHIELAVELNCTHFPLPKQSPTTSTMPDLIGKAKDAMGKHEDKKAQPGDGVEKKADDAANQRKNACLCITGPRTDFSDLQK